MSYGSGTKTPDGRVITAFHVIDGCASLSYAQGLLSTTSLRGTSATIRYTQPLAGRDLVILESIHWNAKGAALAGIEPVFDYAVSLGELTMTVGFPGYFFEPQLSPGFVTQVAIPKTLVLFMRTVDWAGAFVTDAASSGGGSGGPVFDALGRFVAIHVGSSDDDGLELSIQLPLK
jgi:S1-C subfamily serine protease